jgi:importin-9
MLSDLLGPRGLAFDNDDILDDSDDEDLKQDPISQINVQVQRLSPM